MWVGNSEKRLHALFEEARRSGPTVMFFDELDAIGHSRMAVGQSVRNVVAQLLVELDGIGASNDGVFVLGATNQPWSVDPALRRPGRFDRTMLVLPPDEDARAAILRYHLQDRPVGTIDVDGLARATSGMSGADLRLICDEALDLALADAIDASALVPISNDHLRRALGDVKPSTVAWLDAARNHVRYANDSGEYDELAAYLRRRRPR
jgi:SpoVK/Ycf46/Vps4 family AAA+-type ATPase